MRYFYEAEVTRVVDGDTLEVNIDMGLRIFHRTTVRLLGVDTPEVFGVKAGTPEHEQGKVASKFTASWLDDHRDLLTGKWLVRLETHKSEKYGRWLANVFSTKDETTLNDALRAKGWG